MTGGTIKDNTVDTNGGGVYIYAGDSFTPGGSFTMTGGTITDNTGSKNGGGVYVDGTFNIGKDNDTCTITITGNKKAKSLTMYTCARIKKYTSQVSCQMNLISA
jgi:hypothetical protein